MTGRPSSFTQEIADEICERLVEGESLRKICRDDHTPNVATVCRWLASNEGFREHYAHARALQADTLADEILDIADDASLDTKIVGEDEREVCNTEFVELRWSTSPVTWACSRTNWSTPAPSTTDSQTS
jgi:hypothetical protein